MLLKRRQKTEWADFSWAVGIIEGEGWVTPRKFRQYHYARVGIEMTDRDVLERVKNIIGHGNITGPRIRSNSRKPIYKWMITSTAALDLLLKMRPYVSVKKGQEIDEFFFLTEQEDLLRIRGGRQVSEETKQKISSGCQAAWDRKKMEGNGN